MANKTLALGQTLFFQGLDGEALSQLVALASELRVKKGDPVFLEGDPSGALFVVIEGSVRISRSIPGMGEEALAVIEPGGAFGEMGLFDDSPRSADAIGHADATLLMIDRQGLKGLLREDLPLAHDVLWNAVQILASRLRQTTDKMMFMTATSKF